MPWTKEEEKETLLEPEGKGTKEGGGEGEKTPVSVSEPPPTDTSVVQSPFSHPGLEGKSEQELADLLALSDLKDITIREQKAALAGTVTVQAPPIEPTPEPLKISSEDFFLDPAKAIREVTSETIQKEMTEIVAELRTDMAAGRAKSAWDDAAESLPNLANMRPLIEARFQKNGLQNPNVGSIIAVHDLLVGEATRQGSPIPTVAEPTPTPTPVLDNNRVIPQHPVSTQPIATLEKKETFEPLDENEARIARDMKMSHIDFRRWQAVDGEDVLLPAPEKVS